MGDLVENSRKMGILLILGMGNQDRKLKQAEFIKEKIFNVLPQNSVNFEYVNYYQHMEMRQANLFAAMSPESVGGIWHWLRKVTIEQLGDAATYLHRAHAQDSVYKEVHASVSKSLASLRQKIGVDSPIAILAGSLGALIVMDHICDLEEKNLSSQGSVLSQFSSVNGHEQGNGQHQELFQMFPSSPILNQVRLMITWGCNIPMFLSGAPKRHGFRKPHPEFQWYNFFGKPDVLGWPLKPLDVKNGVVKSHSFNHLVTADISVKIGGTPFIHESYWYKKKSRNYMLTKLSEFYGEMYANINK